MRWTLLILPVLVFACEKNNAAPDRFKPEPSKISGKAKEALLLDKAPKGPAAPNWKEAFKHEVRYDAEKSAVIVDVKVMPGYHAYTVGETIGKPLELTFDESSGYLPEGDIVYPKGEEKDLPIGKSVVLHGEAEILAKVKKNEAAKKDQASGKFRYQVCTEEACDRPRTVEFAVAANPG